MAAGSYGIIKYSYDNKIMYLCSTDGGSSGSPILKIDTNEVIGINVNDDKRLMNI